jgi:hypothetical protein
MKLLMVLVVGVGAFAQSIKLEPVSNPAGQSGSQANWAVNAQGDPILNWIETTKDGSDALRYAVLHAGKWSQPRTIASQRHFFRQAAEIPSLVSLSDGTMVAEWIEGPASGGDSEAEFVWFATSRDGVAWSKPVMANRDKTQSQHGLASIVASGPHEASIIWLQALKGDDGPASLMRTVIDASGRILQEENVNPDVCQCCPTSVIRTSQGILVAYRGHTAQDIRDITVVRNDNGKWLPNKTVFPDGWKINACPTNAASASAAGDHVGVAWYTAAGEKPRAEFAVSSDGGATFGKPATVSTGSSYGYVSTAVAPDGAATVSWLERGGQGARLLVRKIPKSGAMGPVAEVAHGSRMDLGYPRLVQAGTDTWIAWGGGPGKVQTAKLSAGN